MVRRCCGASTGQARHVRLERIWNGEAGRNRQAERLRWRASGLIEPDLGTTGTDEKPRADFASRRSPVRSRHAPSRKPLLGEAFRCPDGHRAPLRSTSGQLVGQRRCYRTRSQRASSAPSRALRHRGTAVRSARGTRPGCARSWPLPRVDQRLTSTRDPSVHATSGLTPTHQAGGHRRHPRDDATFGPWQTENLVAGAGPELPSCSGYCAIRSDARSDRPDHECQYSRKEAEAEQAVFAQARQNRGERNEK